MAQIEYACKDVVFHFNKAHLTDQTIPMWVLKFHGETLYVNHVDAQLPWSTKETPDNNHTKGSLKFKNALLRVDENNEATLTPLSFVDKIRLRNQKLGITRIMFSYGGEFHKLLSNNEYKHSPFKNVEGSCGSSYVVCDLLDKEETFLATLTHGSRFRVLKPNETYYQEYDSKKAYISESFDDEDFDD